MSSNKNYPEILRMHGFKQKEANRLYCSYLKEGSCNIVHALVLKDGHNKAVDIRFLVHQKEKDSGSNLSIHENIYFKKEVRILKKLFQERQ